MKKICFLLLLVFSFHAHSTCEFRENSTHESEVCGTIRWLEGPFLNGPGERNFSSLDFFVDPSVKFHEISFYLWMKMPNNHEHGGAAVVVEKVDEFSFSISNILLRQMKGQWFLRVKLDGEVIDPRFDFDFEIALTSWN